MKKIICTVLILTIILCLGFSMLTGLTGCAPEDDGKLKVVVTIFPIYDWVLEILGDRAEEVNVTLLLDSSVDLHSYQPAAEDLIAVAQADLFIYVGGESDEWVEDALEIGANKDRRTMDLLSLLGDKAQIEEIKEGMECTREEIDEFCLGMVRYKRPREVIFADIPRNATGKIEKPKLRKIYGAENLVAQENEE